MAVSTITTYSQSENVNSPHFTDQTEMFSDKVWNEVPFCEQNIENDPDYRLEVIRQEQPDPAVCPPPAGHDQGGGSYPERRAGRDAR